MMAHAWVERKKEVMLSGMMMIMMTWLVNQVVLVLIICSKYGRCVAMNMIQTDLIQTWAEPFEPGLAVGKASEHIPRRNLVENSKRLERDEENGKHFLLRRNKKYRWLFDCSNALTLLMCSLRYLIDKKYNPESMAHQSSRDSLPFLPRWRFFIWS